MNVEIYPKVRSLLEDFTFLLKNEKNRLLYKRRDDLDPDSYDFSFSPTICTETVKTLYESNLCTLCNRRISYKAHQFDEDYPQRPYLILLQNRFKGDQRRFYHEASHNAMFEKIISGTLGFSASELLVREALRCHFGTEDIKSPEYTKNCISNIEKDIESFHLRGILIMGQAATLMFPDKSELATKLGKVFEFLGLPTVVTPGPSRLIYMQEHQFSAEKIREEKLKIFDAVKLFKTNVMKL